ncbi:MAG: hypothetical protein AUJ85_01895 [Elusimicrobia bacterium CG1_02_37_114]|nr:MAG: hypothetical protein AUJ85_01895 [Elusimicrobia bacterium CG1_02_37_114]PIV53868.1 MAG: hypothetical protein COS17_01660 [Elusimicrobia bacterium CG02_land_8_20_14_3_00_37_13]PIZ14221.1 MAG: hypothetical protein COY53_00735 [Elusimicrobia bacterium CG_4_10_14_0_8_um_filter_37_32]
MQLKTKKIIARQILIFISSIIIWSIILANMKLYPRRQHNSPEEFLFMVVLFFCIINLIIWAINTLKQKE